MKNDEKYGLVLAYFCKKCKNEINVSKEKLKEKKINKYKITYFECECCNKKYIVRIDTEKTYKLRKTLDEKIEKVLQYMHGELICTDLELQVKQYEISKLKKEIDILDDKVRESFSGLFDQSQTLKNEWIIVEC